MPTNHTHSHYAVLGVVILLATLFSATREEMRLKTGRVITRSENPLLFWFMIGLMAVCGLVIIYIGLHE
ncbi:hypothetical protein [Paraherbaspirillum soli]|uniref:DUF2970 domain-containing protein n=1 Tax=Paraherbaspirillum soli TaxID=631222 RepID=A0ABW0MC11_9BURK